MKLFCTWEFITISFVRAILTTFSITIPRPPSLISYCRDYIHALSWVILQQHDYEKPMVVLLPYRERLRDGFTGQFDPLSCTISLVWKLSRHLSLHTRNTSLVQMFPKAPPSFGHKNTFSLQEKLVAPLIATPNWRFAMWRQGDKKKERRQLLC